MIILDATNRSLEAKLGGAVAATQPEFVASWVDHTTGAYTPGTTAGALNNTTAVTVVAAPGASTQRSLKYLSIRNADSANVVCTVQYNDNTTIRELVVITLAPDDTLEYVDTAGWAVINTSGQKKSITNVTGTVTANAGTNLNTSTLALEATLADVRTAVQIIDNIVAGSEAQVDIVSAGPVALEAGNLATLAGIVASARAAVNLIAGQAGITAGAGAVGASTPRITLASDDPAVVALQILDNIVAGSEAQVDVVAALPAGTNRIGAVRPSAGIVHMDDIGTAWTVKQKGAVVSSSGNNAFIAAVTSKRLRVLGIYIQAKNSVGTTNTAVKFFDTQGTPAQHANSPEFEGQAREGLRMLSSPGSYIFEAASGQGIQINLSAAQSFYVHVEYAEEP